MQRGDLVLTELGPGKIVSFWEQLSWAFGIPKKQVWAVVELDDHGYRRPFRMDEIQPLGGDHERITGQGPGA
jgi:hypothetical protein